MVCIGAKDENSSRIAARKFARIVQKLGNPVQFSNFKIQNIVGSCNVNFPIDLDKISTKYSDFSNYEPEIFPGLIYRLIEPKAVILIFVSGKLVITGCKRKVDIFTAFKKIYPVLFDSKKKILKRHR